MPSLFPLITDRGRHRPPAPETAPDMDAHSRDVLITACNYVVLETTTERTERRKQTAWPEFYFLLGGGGRRDKNASVLLACVLKPDWSWYWSRTKLLHPRSSRHFMSSYSCLLFIYGIWSHFHDFLPFYEGRIYDDIIIYASSLYAAWMNRKRRCISRSVLHTALYDQIRIRNTSSAVLCL